MCGTPVRIRTAHGTVSRGPIPAAAYRVARQLGSGVWDCQNGSRAHLPGVEPATGTAARVSLRAADSDAMRFDRQHPAPEPESAHDLADLTSVVVMVKPI